MEAAEVVGSARTERGEGRRFPLGGIVQVAWLLLGAVTWSSSTAWAQAVTGRARIIVGPNIRVSQDGEFPHVEPMVAANPLQLKNLLGSAITIGASGKLGVTRSCKTYVSTDGGSTWLDAAFPEQREYGGGDPIMAFGTGGTAYFGALDYAPADGRQRLWLRVYRSEDGGITWGKPATLGYTYDRPQLVVDRSQGTHRGRV